MWTTIIDLCVPLPLIVGVVGGVWCRRGTGERGPAKRWDEAGTWGTRGSSSDEGTDRLWCLLLGGRGDVRLSQWADRSQESQERVSSHGSTKPAPTTRLPQLLCSSLSKVSRTIIKKMQVHNTIMYRAEEIYQNTFEDSAKTWWILFCHLRWDRCQTAPAGLHAPTCPWPGPQACALYDIWPEIVKIKILLLKNKVQNDWQVACSPWLRPA